MRREIEVTVDPTHFPHGVIPAAWGMVAGTYRVSVSFALVLTALCTRSPMFPPGLQMADFWAWLRYRRAIDRGPGLRLNRLWDDVDPHQKTILSDECGVGFVTSVLASRAGYRRFIDTNYVVRGGHPVTVALGRRRRRGPRKSPDYIAEDSNGEFIALECKGTQTNRDSLVNSMARGIPQKQNATAHSPALSMGVVGGLFIPGFENHENALVHFQDPPLDKFDRALAAMTADELRISMRRGFLSTQLFLAGAPIAASEIASAREDNALTFPAQEEVASLLDSRVVFESSMIPGWRRDTPSDSLHALAESELVRGLLSPTPLARLLDRRSDRWTCEESQESSGVTVITTPDGFTYKMQMDESEQADRRLESSQ